MKVVVDGRVFSESRPTGVTNASKLMLGKLTEDTDFELVLTTFGYKPPTVKDIAVSHRHRPTSNRLLNLAASLNLINQQQMFGGFDVLWQPNPMFTPEVKRPMVVTMHDLSLSIWPEFFEWHTRLWYNRWVINFLKQQNKHILLAAVSNRTKKDIEKLYPHWRGKVFTVPAVPPKLESCDPSTLVLEKFNISQPYIVVLSTLEPRKNMAAVYRAHERLLSNNPDLKLVIVGDNRVDVNVRASANVLVTGYVTEEEKSSLLHYAELALYPSYYEGYGYPPLEAIACDTAAVVADSGALPETLSDSVLYVDPNQATIELYKILSTLLKDDTWKQELVEKGKTRLKELHDNYSTKPMANILKQCASE